MAITVTVSGDFTRDELITMIGFVRMLDRDGRHWDIVVDDPGSNIAEAEALLQQWFPQKNISAHVRQ